MRAETLEKLIENFRQAAIEHNEGLCEYSARKTNKAFKREVRTVKKIFERYKQRELIKLLSDEHQAVQLSAATYILEIEEEMALKKLKELRDNGSDFIEHNAFYTIQEWENGNLTIKELLDSVD